MSGEALRPARVTVQAGTALGRIVAAGRPLWNTTARSGRFRPLRQPDGSLVPTMYLAERPDVAFAETVLRLAGDRHDARLRILPRERLAGLRLAAIEFDRDLEFVSLRGLEGRRLLGTRAHANQMLRGGQDTYAETADFAQRLYDAEPDADGLVWTSAQADDGFAAMAWSRDSRTAPGVAELSIVELSEGAGLEFAYECAERAGVLIEG